MCRNSLDRSAVDQPEVFKTFEALSIYSLSELLGTKVLKVLAIHCKLFFFQAAMDAESVASSTSFESLNIHANRQCVGKTKKTFFSSYFIVDYQSTLAFICFHSTHPHTQRTLAVNRLRPLELICSLCSCSFHPLTVSLGNTPCKRPVLQAVVLQRVYVVRMKIADLAGVLGGRCGWTACAEFDRVRSK